MPRLFSRPLRTLIVDPSEAFRDGLVRWAGGRPELVVVGTAESGPEALSAVEELDLDLVLLDAVLPGLDGFRLVRLLKARPRAPLAVINTFHASAAARRAALAAGADGFVPKDDFIAGCELLLGDLVELGSGPGDSVRGLERSVRPVSRIARDR